MSRSIRIEKDIPMKMRDGIPWFPGLEISGSVVFSLIPNRRLTILPWVSLFDLTSQSEKRCFISILSSEEHSER